MFEVLGLSPEQRQQLDEIVKETEPEFEKYIDKILEWETNFQDRLHGDLMDIMSTLPPLPMGPSQQEWEQRQQLADDVRKRILAELLPELDAATEFRKRLGSALIIKMFDVLTDEQYARVIDLIDNPPDYVVALLKRWREQSGESEESKEAEEGEKSGAWVPGPGSWRPGDPIPGAYRIERETRRGFPRRE